MHISEVSLGLLVTLRSATKLLLKLLMPPQSLTPKPENKNCTFQVPKIYPLKENRTLEGTTHLQASGACSSSATSPAAAKRSTVTFCDFAETLKALKTLKNPKKP